jgi:hypothetical protein
LRRPPHTDLGAQQDTLVAAVERVDLVHTELNVKVACVETAHHNPPLNSRQPTNGRRRPKEDDDTGGDFVSTTHKLEFPKYDGTDDPLPWLNRCERYFHVRRTPEQKRVALAACYLLDDAQLWFHRMELNGGRPTWTQFVQLVNARFGSVDEFSKKFMALSCRDPSITEPQQIQLFITDLGDPLRTDATLQQPSTLDDAVIFARAYEQRNASRDAGQPQSARGGGRFANRTTTQPTAPSPTASAGSSTATNVKPASSVRNRTLTLIEREDDTGS